MVDERPAEEHVTPLTLYVSTEHGAEGGQVADPEETAPPPRQRLTRERVLAAALAVIDRDGVEGLSMRKLGAETGVEAMSLYNHVADKGDVLDGVVGLLWREVADRLRPATTWQQHARELAVAVRAVAHAHPAAYPLVFTRGGMPPELLEIGSQLQARLREAGFGELATDAMLALGSHVAGQALAELSWSTQSAGVAGSPGQRSDHPGPADPAIPASQVLAVVDSASQFDYTLELVIEGLQARLGDRA